MSVFHDSPDVLGEKTVYSMLTYTPEIERGHGRDLAILTHGWISGADSMEDMARYLREVRGMSTFRTDLSTTFSSLRTLIGELVEQVGKVIADQDEFDRVHFVGYSMGGLLTVVLASTIRFKRPGRLVTLGTPFRGSPLQNALKRAAPGLTGRVESIGYAGRLLEMVSGADLKGIDVGLVAGDKTYTPADALFRGEYDLRASAFGKIPNDGTVETSSALGYGGKVRDRVTLGLNHGELARSPVAAEQVWTFLETGRFSGTVGDPH